MKRRILLRKCPHCDIRVPTLAGKKVKHCQPKRNRMSPAQKASLAARKDRLKGDD